MYHTGKKLQIEFMKKDTEVSMEVYNEMLGVLPPQQMANNAFLVGEPTTHNKDLSGHFNPLYELYFLSNDKAYYGGLASENDFITFLIPIQ